MALLADQIKSIILYNKMVVLDYYVVLDTSTQIKHAINPY